MPVKMTVLKDNQSNIVSPLVAATSLGEQQGCVIFIAANAGYPDDVCWIEFPDSNGYVYQPSIQVKGSDGQSTTIVNWKFSNNDIPTFPLTITGANTIKLYAVQSSPK